MILDNILMAAKLCRMELKWCIVTISSRWSILMWLEIVALRKVCNILLILVKRC